MFISIKDLLASHIANAPATLCPILDSIASDLEQSNQATTHTQVVYIADPGQATFEELSAWLKNIGISIAEGWDRKDNYFLSLSLASESTAVITKEATTPAVRTMNDYARMIVGLSAFFCLPLLYAMSSTMEGIVFFFMAGAPAILLGAVILNRVGIRRTTLPALLQEPAYTIGASRAAVLKIQGGPMSMCRGSDPRTSPKRTTEVWIYAGLTNHRHFLELSRDKDKGRSRLKFDQEERLFSYDNYGDLHICMRPDSAATNPGFFGIGSSKDDVLHAEGTPMSVDYRSKPRQPNGYPDIIVEVWTYMCHTIWFDAAGKVASVDISEELPILDAEIPHCDRFHPVRLSGETAQKGRNPQ